MDIINQWLDVDYWLLAKVFSVLVIAFLANALTQRLLKRLNHYFSQTKNGWDDVIVSSASRPLAWMIALYGLLLAMQMVNQDMPFTLFSKILSHQDLVFLAMLGWFAVSFIEGAKNILVAKADDPHHVTTLIAVARIVRIAIIITIVLIALQTMGYSIGGLLAFGGIGGLAVGFAAQDLLANFFGGLMIYLDRPFSVGDWVRSPDREIEGTVEDIGWRLTKIRTFDQRPLYIPNAVFTKISLENPSRMNNRRIYETIGIRYTDAAAMEAIIANVKHMLQSHDAIDLNKTLIVNFNTFAPSSLDFFVYAFTKTTDWVRFHGIKQDILLKILAIIHDHGADVAFPTSTVHIEPSELTATAVTERN